MKTKNLFWLPAIALVFALRHGWRCLSTGVFAARTLLCIITAGTLLLCAACDNGTGGGGGRRGPGTPSGPVTPSVPLSAEYVSYDADGTEYKLEITETVTGRAVYDPKSGDKYTLTITFNDENGNKTVKISTGTVAIDINSGTQEIEITLKHTGGETVVTVSGDGITMISFSAAIPVDDGEPVPKPEALPYALNEAGTGYILIKGIVKPNGEANILDKLPDNKPVTAIGGGAFYQYTSLTSVTIPASVTSIGDGAFADCTSLTSVTIPASVTSIDVFTFANCTSLATVTFAQGSRLDAFERGVFYGCTSLTSINIPAGVTYIGYDAFGHCTSLASITIPEGVTYIDILAFQNCTNLTEITIPASVTTIGADDNNFAGTFKDCTSLATVTFATNSQLEIIGNGMFEGCTSLTSITFPASVTSIGHSIDEWAGTFFGCTNLKTVTFESGSRLQYIGRGTFQDCTSLTSVPIPAGVTSIGRSAFENCTSLTSITIPASVTSIGNPSPTDDWVGTFYDCTSLKTVTFDEGSRLEAIGKGVFQGCTSLTSIEIPASVTSIGSQAFFGCTSLISVTIPSSVTSIGYDAFSTSTNIVSITIPSSVTSIGRLAFGSWTPSQTINVQGKADRAAAIAAGWDNEWDLYCGAVINYGQ
jgi:hypothetical protein